MRLHSFVFVLLCISSGFVQATRNYRSAKIAYVYNKASHHIADKTRLDKLEDELAKFDDLYMEMKDKTHTGKGGEKDSELIDEKLMRLLERHDLHITSSTFREKIKHLNLYQRQLEDVLTKTFEDKDANKIWTTIAESDVSEAYKLDIYDRLEKLERKLTQLQNDRETLNDEHHENSIHLNEDVDKKRKATDQQITDVRNEIKHIRDEIKIEIESPFEDEHIRSLWRKTLLERQLSNKDFDEMKSHLEYFDQKFKKRAYIKKELDASPDGKKMYAEDDNLKSKYEELDRTFTKALTYLKEKYKHTEL
ncbi:unnamed protein product [Auanema sp. JU1783]|nr:unnamed protein product [Auanema sp. JU1783]